MPRQPFWDEKKKKYEGNGCALTSVPEELWTKCKDAKIVDLSGNRISNLPSQIRELTVLEELNLADNNFQMFPDAVCLLKSLKVLNLESNSLTSVPYNVIQLKELREVNLMKTNTLSFPRMICRVQSLTKLSFGYKELPPRVTSLPDDVLVTLRLEELHLHCCNLSLFPKVIFKIKTLKVLSLVWCKIADDLYDLGELSNLVQLTLSCNELASLPDSIGKLLRLEVLHANNNKLKSIPTALKSMSKLKTIDLDENPLCPGKKVTCENNASKAKSIISEVLVAQAKQQLSLPLQTKQTTSTTSQQAKVEIKRTVTPTQQSYLKSITSAKQSDQPSKVATRPTSTPTYRSSLASSFQTKQTETSPKRPDSQPYRSYLTPPPTSSTCRDAQAVGTSLPQKREVSTPTYQSYLKSTPQTKHGLQFPSGKSPVQATSSANAKMVVQASTPSAKTPIQATSSIMSQNRASPKKQEVTQNLQSQQERRQEELRQKQRLELLRQQRQQLAKKTEIPPQAKTAEISTRSTSRASSSIGVYPMGNRPRGQAIIINNFKFGDSQQRRDGTEFDRGNLHILLKDLHFGVHVYNDLSANEMECVVKTFSIEDHSFFNCFVLCVLSHGSQGKVYGTDSKSVEIRDLTKHFSADNCSTLAGKPKLFFIQACQGPTSMGAVLATDAVFGNNLIPNEADFVIGYSTVPGYVSYRNTGKGSYYIKALVDQLRQLGNEHDLVSILAKVRDEVSKSVHSLEGGRYYTQVPTVVSTLGKQVYLKM